jgi:hypothetical protein
MADEHIERFIAFLGVPAWAENGEAIQREPREDLEHLRGTVAQSFFVVFVQEHDMIARHACVPDEGASSEGDVGELFEHFLGAFEAEEDLVEPGTPNFEVHLATGPEERKSVGRGSDTSADDVFGGDDALFGDVVHVSSPSYTGGEEEMRVDLDPHFGWQLHEKTSVL